MKKLSLSLVFILFFWPAFSHEGQLADKLLSFLSMNPNDATPEQANTFLGKPDTIEKSNKQNVWRYNSPDEKLVIYWDNKAAKLQKLEFNKMAETAKTTLDNTLPYRLKSGITAMQDAIKLLGFPKGLTIKGANQEMHYFFKNNTLNLFFRKGTLVNYTLF
jgi:hypothetical protein